MFPIKYDGIWEMYKKAEASFWTGAWFFAALARSRAVFIVDVCSKTMTSQFKHSPVVVQTAQPRKLIFLTT